MTSITAVPLEVAAVCDGDRWELVASGELDAASAGRLLDAAAVLAAHRVPTVNLDLTGVGFADSAGWRLASDAVALLEAAGTAVQIGELGPGVRRLLAALEEASAATGR